MENDVDGVEIVFKKETAGLEGVDEEEVLKLKALCHVKIKTISLFH
jgi:hypothetical protein